MIHKLTIGNFGSNCYIVEVPERDTCIIVDPGGEAAKINRVLKEQELTPVRIFATHGHIDHIGAVETLKKQYDIPFSVHSADAYLVNGIVSQAEMFGLEAPEIPEIDQELDQEDRIEVDTLQMDVHHTPGHSPGGVTFSIINLQDPQHLLVGDCIFAGSIGRTDFPQSSHSDLMQSIHGIIMDYPEDTVIHPGHGPDTTVRSEKEQNPFLQ